MLAVLVEQLVSAAVLAALLFLVSVGLSLVFGILGVANFAHGIFYMLGAYVGFTVVHLSGSFWLSLVAAPLVVGLVGAALEASTLRFIYHRPPIYQLLLTFGLALILEEAIRILYGPTAKGVDPPAGLQGSVELFGGVSAVPSVPDRRRRRRGRRALGPAHADPSGTRRPRRRSE